MVSGQIYTDSEYGIIKIRKVYPKGSVAIADELNEDLTYKLKFPNKLDGEANWVTRAITKERGRELVPYAFLSDGVQVVEQQELF